MDEEGGLLNNDVFLRDLKTKPCKIQQKHIYIIRFWVIFFVNIENNVNNSGFVAMCDKERKKCIYLLKYHEFEWTLFCGGGLLEEGLLNLLL